MEINAGIVALIVLMGALALIGGGVFYVDGRAKNSFTREECLRNRVAQWALSAADWESFRVASGKVAHLQSRLATLKVVVTLIVVATIVFAQAMDAAPGKSRDHILGLAFAAGLLLAIFAAFLWYEQKVARRREGCSYDVVIGAQGMVETFDRNGEACDREVTLFARPFEPNSHLNRSVNWAHVRNMSLLSRAEVVLVGDVPALVVTCNEKTRYEIEVRVPIPRGKEAEAKRAAEALRAMRASAKAV